MKFFIFYLFFFLNFSVEANTKYKKLYDEILELGIPNDFSIGLVTICQSSYFFKNLKDNKNYPRFGDLQSWQDLCTRILKRKNKALDKKFLKKNLKIISLSDTNGILTGYYEPEIKISKKKNKKYKYPILKKRKLLELDRKSILKNYKNNDVIYWTDDNINLFFLQIQGSGIGVMENGKKIKLLYGGNNRFPYTSIGKILVDRGFLKRDQVSLSSIKEWLRKNSGRRDEIFFMNKRYIFFKEEPHNEKFALGSMGVNLVPRISIAIDKKIYPFGLPMLLNTSDKKFNSFVIAHDTGSAIKGFNRADLFVGRGVAAEEIAGNLKKSLQLLVLVPYN